jgi:hypothetical protein
MKYKCDICERIFDRKSTYDNHLKRKNTCKPIINELLDLTFKNKNITSTNDSKTFPSVSQAFPTRFPSVSCNYECFTCHNKYMTRSGLFKHKKRDHRDYEEDTNIITDIIKNNNIDEVKQELLVTKQELHETKQKLEELTNNKQNMIPIQNTLTNANNMTNSNNTTVNNINNIFTDFGDEKLEMLTLEDRQDICSQPCDSIYKIVQKMHVNKKLPNYMNLCVENLRSNVMYAISKDKFIATDKSITLYDVIHIAGYRLREIVENNKDLSTIQKESLLSVYNFILRYDPSNEDFDGTIIL